MFKRVRWIGMGAVAGVGASAWAQRRLRRTLDEHPAIQIGADVVTTARRVGRDLGDALRDGRRAMAQREAALRADLAARTDPDSVRDRRPVTRSAAGEESGAAGPHLHVVNASARSARAQPGRRQEPGRKADPGGIDRGGANRSGADRDGVDRDGVDRGGHPTARPAPLRLEGGEPTDPPRPARRRRRG